MNDRVSAAISLNKKDAETKENKAQGDASLENAVYGLYARNDITHPDGKTGVIYKAGSQIGTLTTDKEGKARIENLYLGEYYIKEITPSVGYLADEHEYDLVCSDEGDLTAVVEKECTSLETVKKQPFELIKAANNGDTDAAVKSVLSEQLLLLRIFFEVNKDSNADVFSIRKHEIFAQYIEKLKQNNREYLETMLDTVTDFMIHSDNYDEISITDLEKAGITSGDIRKTVNSGILLSKKLVFHEGTIARNEKEVVYFVFDEMRDYCLARQILLNNVSAYYVDGESVIEKLKQLKASGASCAEGVIHYCYVFFKTDELVSKLEQTEKMCNSILDLYRIPEGGERKSYWSMRYREEFQNLGLRIILTSGLELTDFEITYIQDCLRKDPYEDGGMFFDTMLDGTLYGGIYNLDIYLGILFGLKNKDAILNTFHTISARNNMDDRFIPEDFIKYYNELSDSERKLQIQKIAELFLLCFKLHDKDKQEELEDFFYNLPTHDKVQNDMILEMRIACGLEVKDYE